MRIVVSLIQMHDDLSHECLQLFSNLTKNVSVDISDNKCHQPTGRTLEIDIIKEQSKDYNMKAIYNRMLYDADIVIGLDEDCFVIDADGLLAMCNDMIDNGIAYRAMRELSGVSTHRAKVQNALQCDCNSFLMLTQPKLIRNRMPSLHTVMTNHFPATGYIEPYWSIFRQLDKLGLSNRELSGYTHTDDISTIITHKGKPVALHTWFARSWLNNKLDEYNINQHQRIADRIQEAKSGKVDPRFGCIVKSEIPCTPH